MARPQADKGEPGLLIRLRGMAPSLVPSLRRVADQILADPATAATRTISELATAASTSETTVLRLCRRLGVPGYRELRVILATESGREAERAGARGFSQDIGRTDSLDAIIETITFADQQAVVDTSITLDRRAVSRVVDALAEAGRIEVFGSGVSGIVAVDLQQKLHRRGLVAFNGTDAHLALTGAALMGPGDVMVAITASGQTRDTIEVLAEANRRGARTVCITSASQSPAARAADEVLLTAARETTFRTGAMSSRIAALTVVDILMTAVVQRHFGARVSALEATHSAVAVRRVEPQPNTDEQPAGTGGPKTIAAPVPAHERADVDSPTEEPNPRTADLDVLSTLDLLRVINDEDAIVPQAVAATLPGLATVVDEAATRVRAGGHVHYFGAGTSGRLAVLDAAELIPTFNVPEGLVVAHLAGGVAVLGRAGENVEDDESAAAHEVTASVTPGDVVIGLAASGRTPYIRGALRRARELGAFTVLVSSNPRAPLAEHADVTLIADTGPEALTGSTRLKAGTAQKLVLNTFSTALMVRLERTYGNFMVEVQPINAKLHGRVLRILRQATGAADEQCQAALARSDGELRTALLDLLWTAAGRSRTAPSDRVAACRVALARSRGDIRAALALLDHQGKGRTAGRTAP